jgi:hypothetical protein
VNITQNSLDRNHQKRFEDNDLADILFNAIEKKAGGRTVPDWAREQEIKKLKQARESNVCTLNEFRERLGLKSAFAPPHFSHSLSYYLQNSSHSKNGIGT